MFRDSRESLAEAVQSLGANSIGSMEIGLSKALFEPPKGEKIELREFPDRKAGTETLARFEIDLPI